MLRKYNSELEFWDKLSKKWTFHILLLLNATEKASFGVLKSAISPITSKVLSSRLKMLQEAGLIIRDIVIEEPLRVCYFLTDEGKRFLDFFMGTIDNFTQGKK